MTLPSALVTAIENGTSTGVSATDLGLRGRAEVHIHEGHCVQVVERRSRFLRKDAERFAELLAAARLHTGCELAGSVVVRRAPVCSQAQAWLEAQGIHIGAY